jgi:hypothetical protein
VKRILYLVLYYGIAQHLPDSHLRGGELPTSWRSLLCHGFVASADRHIYLRSGVFPADRRYPHIAQRASIAAGARIYGGRIGPGLVVGSHSALFKGNRAYDDLDKAVGHHGTTPVNLPVIEDFALVGERALISKNGVSGREP